ncbi:MAG: HAD family phosphatase [Proteobacteria bacterium]|nr:HAD family phosphatase [Pseudomonadota bacterium]
MKKAVIFDLGKVFVDFDVGLACKNIGAVLNESESDVFRFLFQNGLEDRFERGEISTDEFYQEFLKRFKNPFLRSDLERACADIFTVKQDSVDFLWRLKQKFSGNIILLSNTNAIHWEFIKQKWSFVGWFNERVLSFEEGVMKPNPKIYHKAIQLAGCRPEECFFTDDLQANVEGAVKCGIHSEVFISANQIEPIICKLI